MDWNLKPSSWDFTEFAQGTLPNIDGDGIGSGSSSFAAQGDFSVDLKLGQVTNPPVMGKWEVEETHLVSKKVPSQPPPPPPPAPAGSLMKRPRGTQNGAGALNQVVSCLVDGCHADLSSCREYHRRHKVCELHSKTPEVTIGGHKQRFCQQCSRFHSLEEFDEGKRSCRKRLEGHNRRRRKPQLDPLIRSPVNCLSNYQGDRLLPSSNSHLYPSTAFGSNPPWVGMDSPRNAKVTLYNQRHQQMLFLGMPSLLPESSAGAFSGEDGKQFVSLQGHQTAPGAGARASSVSQPVHHPRIAVSSETGSGSGSRSGNNMFCDGLLTLQVQDSECALSLLSSPKMQTPGIGMLRPHGHPPQLLGGNHSQGLVPVESVLISSHCHESESNVQCHGGMCHLGRVESPSKKDHPPQTLPFHWD